MPRIFIVIIIWTVLLGFTVPVNGQSVKNWNIDFSPNYTNDIVDRANRTEGSFGFNVIGRREFASRKNSQFTMGLGYLRTQYNERRYCVNQSYQDCLWEHRYQFTLLMIGWKLNAHRFYFHPELGLGFSHRNRVGFGVNENRKKTSGPFKDEASSISDGTFGFNLTTGLRFNLGNYTLLTGLRYFIGADKNVYGFGPVIGIAW